MYRTAYYGYIYSNPGFKSYANFSQKFNTSLRQMLHHMRFRLKLVKR